MIFNTTRKNEDYDVESTRLVGKPFSFLQRIKQGGIGSGRLIINKTSPELKLYNPQFSQLNYGNIELRPKGIIIHYTRKLERYAWVIPYYRLIIYKSQFFSIHADGNFIQFLMNKNYLDNKRFIERMAQLKIEALNLEYYDY